MSDYSRGYEDGKRAAEDGTELGARVGDTAMEFLSLGFCQESEDYKRGFNDGVAGEEEEDED